MDKLIFGSEDLKLNMVSELGIHHIKKAEPQLRQRHRKIQLTFMLEGILQWKAPDGREIKLKGGEYCITRPGDTFHVPYNVLAPCHVIWMLIDPYGKDAQKDSLFSKKELKQMSRVLTGSGDFVIKTPPATAFYLKEIQKISQTSSKSRIDELDMQKIRLCLMGIFIESVKIASQGVFYDDWPETGLVRQVKQIVLEHPHEFLNTQEIAVRFNLSDSLFSKKFRKETGISLADFVRRIKLEESVKLIRHSSKSITEIAYSLGFCSSQYYATLFKKYFGKTPRQFRMERP